MTESEALIVLNSIPGLGPVRIRRLVDHFGFPSAVFRQNPASLAAAGNFPAEVAEEILHQNGGNFLRQEMELIQKYRVRVMTFLDDDYPALLKQIADPPAVLYLRGSWSKDMECAVAVVGSRHASVYGLTVAEDFAGKLTQLGITIVSGLAKGIDAAAHRGTLRAGGKTVAVMGCGLTHVYPPDHEKLFHQIAESGAVVSEFPMTTPPLPYHFPRRNRIVSGLSLGVVVVEASAKSGALITSRCAMEQGREVFAVPGQVGANTQGVHRLIQDGAKLVTSVDDILEEIRVPLTAFVRDGGPPKSSDTKNRIDLSDEENLVYTHIGIAPVNIDSLIEKCGRSLAQLSRILFELELKGLVRQMPGCLVVRSKK